MGLLGGWAFSYGRGTPVQLLLLHILSRVPSPDPAPLPAWKRAEDLGLRPLGQREWEQAWLGVRTGSWMGPPLGKRAPRGFWDQKL